MSKKILLSEIRPDLIEEWDFEKNKDISPYNISYSSGKRVWWICKKNKEHKWEAIISNRTRLNNGCPYCSGKKVSAENSLAIKNPQLAKEWNYKLNRDLTPNDVSCGSGRKVWWICEKGHEWKAAIHQRNNTGSGCPYCLGRLASKENCLATLYPEIAAQWHPTKNGELTPYDVTIQTNKKVWWVCERNHEWKASVSHRVRGSGCVYCCNQKVNIENCLATNDPELSKEWNYEKNKGLTPYDVTKGSKKVVWWICSNNHEWRASVVNRSKGRGCPYCNSRLVHIDNCLATLNPELSKQWHPNKNTITPYDVMPNSNKKVWWLGECDHEWQAVISSRTRGNNCPICNESKGEKEIRKFLDEKGLIYKRQYEIKGLVGIGGKELKFDFAVLNSSDEIISLIEYDGIFHYEQQYENDGHQTVKLHDKIKNEYCKKNNIKLIRIPYWEFDNIREILQKELKIN